MLKETLTIVVPTHERHHLLHRFIEYTKSLNAQVIIADSSSTPFMHELPEGFKYLHVPDENFGSKLYKAMLYVDTQYSCMCADDDFISEYGLTKGIEFLEKNIDYVSVQGQYVDFSYSDQKISSAAMYTNVLGYSVDGDTQLERITQAFNPYMHQFYSVQRTQILTKALSVVSNIKAITPVEIAISLVGSVFGKHCMLSVFWAARDREIYSSYTVKNELAGNEDGQGVNEQSLVTVVKDWKIYLLSEDGMLFKRNYFDVISDVVVEKMEQSRLFDAAFSAYISDRTIINSNSKLSFKKSIRKVIKKLMPYYVLNVYRLIRDASFRYKHPLGYPWSNIHSADDWKRMKDVILKYSGVVNLK